MSKGLDRFLGDSQLNSFQKLENNPLEKKVYSEKYTELNDFLQRSNLKLQNKVKDYLRVGAIAKRGFEKASEVYTNQLEIPEESFFSLEKGQVPTLLHRYSKNLNRFDKNPLKELIKNFEQDIKEVAFKYRGQVKKNYGKTKLARKIKLNHIEALDYVLKNCKMKEIENKTDVIEALMLAHRIGVTDVILPSWDKRKVDNNKVYEFIKDAFKKQITQAQILNKISSKFGMFMSKSTFYRYIRENKRLIKLIPETDILHLQSNAG